MPLLAVGFISYVRSTSIFCFAFLTYMHLLYGVIIHSACTLPARRSPSVGLRPTPENPQFGIQYAHDARPTGACVASDYRGACPNKSSSRRRRRFRRPGTLGGPAGRRRSASGTAAPGDGDVDETRVASRCFPCLRSRRDAGFPHLGGAITRGALPRTALLPARVS